MKPRVQEESVHPGIGQLVPRYGARAARDATAPGDRYVSSRPLVMAGILAAPFVIAGYVGLTVLLFLPLLGLRSMFPRRSPLPRWYGDALRYSAVGSL